MINHPMNQSKFTNYGIIVHALHKSASMFLHKFFKNLSYEKHIEYFSENNNPPNNQELQTDINTRFCLCPERSFDTKKYNYDNISNLTHIIQIRDPRDILVSEYFSLGWIHSDSEWGEQKKQQREDVKLMSIDEYVIKAADEWAGFSNQPLKNRYQPLLNRYTFADCQVIIVKYEKMVTDFRSWVCQVIKPFQFNPVLERILIERYCYKYRKEFWKNKESLVHKRRITPGDHREKLKPETIDKLNHIFQDILVKFNYNETS